MRWMTRTTAMMMTVILPIIAVIPSNDKFKSAVVLSIPIAANIGGIATPIGTPPNAIVFSSGELTISQMAKTGFILNVVGVLIVVLFSIFFI